MPTHTESKIFSILNKWSGSLGGIVIIVGLIAWAMSIRHDTQDSQKGLVEVRLEITKQGDRFGAVELRLGAIEQRLSRVETKLERLDRIEQKLDLLLERKGK